jgi:hypothetical protein
MPGRQVFGDPEGCQKMEAYFSFPILLIASKAYPVDPDAHPCETLALPG